MSSELAILGGTALALLAVLGLVLGIAYRAVWLSDRFRVPERFRKRRRPKPSPARISTPAHIQLPDPLRARAASYRSELPVPYPDAVATSEYARQRLERYRREGLGAVTRRRSDPPTG